MEIPLRSLEKQLFKIFQFFEFSLYKSTYIQCIQQRIVSKSQLLVVSGQSLLVLHIADCIKPLSNKFRHRPTHELRIYIYILLEVLDSIKYYIVSNMISVNKYSRYHTDLNHLLHGFHRGLFEHSNSSLPQKPAPKASFLESVREKTIHDVWVHGPTM